MEMKEECSSPSPTLNAMLSSLGGAEVVSSLMLAASPTNSTSHSSETAAIASSAPTPGLLPNGKKTKGRVKIKMEYINNKLRRYTTFSKRKTGIMKKAFELSTLTGTQVMLLVASETGHVYAFATNKFRPMIMSDAGRGLIQNCLAQPDEDTVETAPTRCEFTFDAGAATTARKRKMPGGVPGGAGSGSSSGTPAPQNDGEGGGLSFVPTMVPTSLFAYTEEDYNEASDASDSEEAATAVEEADEEKDDKDCHREMSTAMKTAAPGSRIKTIQDALRAAASNREAKAAAAGKKRKTGASSATSFFPSATSSSSPLSNSGNIAIPTSLLGPLLMAAAATMTSAGSSVPCPSASSSSCPPAASANGTILYQGPQGIVYANPASDEAAGGAAPGNLLASVAKTAEEAAAAQSLINAGFPFSNVLCLQQLMETAALSGAAKGE